MNKPIIRLAKPIIGLSEYANVVKVLRSGKLAQGSQVKNLEERFSSILENRSCVAVNSGTSGLVTALLAIGVQPNDEVLVPSFTFAATANAVRIVGALPVFVDIDSQTFNLDVKDARAKVTSKTSAILTVHLFGLCSNMPEIAQLADEKSLKIIEDASQAHLASIHGRQAGTFGDAAVFSFYPTKNMTTGEGGLISFKRDTDARVARMIRNQGMEKKYENEIVGFNFRMSDLHAAIGLAQFKKLPHWTEKRIKNAEFLSRKIESDVTPITPTGYKHVFHQFTIRVKSNREGFMQKLENAGIESGVYYPTPVHELTPYRADLKLEFTEAASKQVVSLPVHPSLSNRDLNRIVEVVNRALGSK